MMFRALHQGNQTEQFQEDQQPCLLSFWIWSSPAMVLPFVGLAGSS